MNESWVNILCDWANRNGLDVLPREKDKLTNLTILNLESSRLKELPKEVGNLSNLNELWLHDNQLKTLPEEICNLKKLSCLRLISNPDLILTIKQEEWIEGLKKMVVKSILT